MYISVICPVYNEGKYIRKCVASMLAQDVDKESFEVIFVDGMSTDATRKIIGDFMEKHPFIKLLDNPQQIVPTAMNIGIEAARGDVIVRIDGHSDYPADYVSTLVHYLFALDADNVGCRCITRPIDSTAKCIAIAEALSCKFGMGNSHFRTENNCSPKKVDTVPFGCFKREIFDKIGLYDEELIRNQDDELNGRILKSGGTIYLIPGVAVTYYARDSFRKIEKMYYQYGLFKPLVNKKLGAPATVRQFFPVLFVGGLFAGGALSFFFNWAIGTYIAVILLYLLLGTAIGINTGIRHKKPLLIAYMPVVFFLIHFSYGWGYIAGIWKLLSGQKISVATNR